MSVADVPAAAPDWRLYLANGASRPIGMLPPPPSWRVFDGGPPIDLPAKMRTEAEGLNIRARAYQADERTVNLVNAAIYLRRPLLVTGRPGTGKSTLARSIAHELALGPVIVWPITSRSSLRDSLYQYDALGRLEGETAPVRPADRVGRYITLGPLGTALLPWRQPRVLLVDELDKSDIDLPNDLLHAFEEGTFDIPELSRLPEGDDDATVHTAEGLPVSVHRGHVRCLAFPIVVITPPRPDALARIVDGLLGAGTAAASADVIEDYLVRRDNADIATDQLLNALFLVRSQPIPDATKEELKTALLRELNPGFT
jgi:hypothetical protein